MKQHIGYCGIKCSDCAIYKATVNNDIKMKAEIARNWSTAEYELKEEEINCFGCRSNNTEVISFVLGCDIRECANKNSVSYCCLCKSYECEKLEKVFQKSVDARANLESIKNKSLKLKGNKSSN